MGEAFEYTKRIGWADCDPELIAFTGRIPYFALEAIDAWWSHQTGLGWYELNLDRKIGTPFVHMSIDFSSPVTPRHPLICKVELTKLGTKSIGFRVTGSQDNTTCFVGNFVCVFVVAQDLISREPPEDIRAILAPLVVD